MRTITAAVALLCLLVACTRLTADNYAKLRLGMTYEETTSLLGSPTKCSDALGAKSCMWGDEARNIKVNFIADKVVLYTGENLR
jgi:hypothetical protein